jgi:hypothetical protein
MKAIIYDGITYPSRAALARHLAPLVGRSVETVWYMLERLRDDGADVVRRCAGPCRYRMGKPIAFEGVTHHSRGALARHLAPRVGRTFRAVEVMLAELGDDGEAVVRRYREPMRRGEQDRSIRERSRRRRRPSRRTFDQSQHGSL